MKTLLPIRLIVLFTFLFLSLPILDLSAQDTATEVEAPEAITDAPGDTQVIETVSPAAEAGPEDVQVQGDFIEQDNDTPDATILSKIIGPINSALASVLFFDLFFGQVEGLELPFLVFVLAFGAVFFTLWFRFINIRGFKHSIHVIAGKYDNPEDEGEISHFKALTSALSATVGLGNIAGVAIAIQLGGPGAVFWMLVMAIFGMTAKFSSCTLSQMYRKVNADGSISGGPMYYLDLGLKSISPGLGVLGKVLAVLYALMIMGGAIGGGNMFQANQTAEAITSAFQIPPTPAVNFGIGVVLAILVGMVILGGIKRIGYATSRLVPAMCGIYVVAALFVICTNISAIPHAIKLIFTMAFTENAVYGGFLGVLIWGVKRASFSNEAGLGSAAVAHAAAKTKEPVREGMVAMIGPFIDTMVVCMMTAMVVIITGAWNDPSIPSEAGVELTSAAFASAISWFPFVLSACILLFAYSTMISWCYYGERGWIYLVDHLGDHAGLKSVIVFRIIFVLAITAGAVLSLEEVLTFSDLMILSMALPNIIGSIILAPKVRAKLNDYWGRLQSGEMKPV